MISVVIPTYQRLDQLSRCLDRLDPAVQSLAADQYEVIVTDDGGEITAQSMIARRYPQVRWMAGPRRGPAANRNNGARAARGEFIAFTDDDCVPSANWLSSYSAAIQVGRQLYEGQTTCVAGIPSPLYQAPLNSTGGCLWSCNMMVSKDIFASLRGFDEAYPRPHMEDADLRARAARAGICPLWVPDAIVDHPPRRAALFRRIALDHECEVIFKLKHGQRARLAPMLYYTLRQRFHTLRQYPLSRDSLLFAGSTVVEAYWFIVLFRRWTLRYRVTQESGAL